MTTSDEERRGQGYELVAEVLQRLAPAELPDLPQVWAEWVADPVGPNEFGNGDRILGSGLAGALVEWAPIAVAFVGTEVVGAAAVDAAKDQLRDTAGKAVHGLTAWRRQRRGAAAANAPIPEYTPEQIADIGRDAERAAAALGHSSEEAKAFADLLVGCLFRRRQDAR